MSILANHLTTYRDGTNGVTAATTPSITPHVNRLILCAVSNEGSNVVAAPTVTGCGLTWDLILSAVNPGGTGRLSVYRAMGSPTSGGLTATFGAAVNGISFEIDEFKNVLTGANGANAVVQSVVRDPGVSNVTSATITLAAFADANNVPYGAWHHNTAAAFVAGSGFTILGHDEATIGGTICAEWGAANDNTVDISQGSGPRIYGVAIEIANGPIILAKTERESARGSCRGAFRGVAHR